MSWLSDMFSKPQFVSPDIEGQYAPILEQFRKNPEILKNFLQYYMPQVGGQYSELMRDIDTTVKDPRLKTFSRLEAMNKLARTTGGALGQATQQQEGAEFQQRAGMAGMLREKASDVMNVKMWNQSRQDSHKAAMTAFLGEMISSFIEGGGIKSIGKGLSGMAGSFKNNEQVGGVNTDVGGVDMGSMPSWMKFLDFANLPMPMA